MTDRLRKPASRMNQSLQKKVGLKLKDRNRKRKNIESDIENFTERVQKHRALKVQLDFKNKKQKIDGVAKKLDVYLSKLSPAGKVKAIGQSCNETLSPASKSSLSQMLSNEAENPLSGIHQCI